MKPLRQTLVSLLSRKTSGRRLIPEIDGLRSIAIMSVVFFHASANFWHYTGRVVSDNPADRWLFKVLETGEYGVPLFFAISGFILAVPFANKHLHGERAPSLKKYFLRRITRLEPPYIFALTIFMLKHVVERVALGHESGALPEILSHYGASCFYIHNAIYGEPSTIAVIAWSLEIEVQFYILAPIITWVFAIANVPLRRAIIAAAIVGFSLAFGVEKPIDGLTILNHAPYFLVGLLLADVYLCGLRDKETKSGLWDLAGFAALGGVFLFKAYHLAPTITTPWLILAGYVAVFRGNLLRRLFRWTPVVILGGMCYTIYLWHFTVIAAFRHPFFMVFDPEPTLGWRVLYVLAASVPAVAVSAVLFALIERPTMDPKWPQKLWAFVRRKPHAG